MSERGGWQCRKCHAHNESHLRCGSCWTKRASASSATKRPRGADENTPRRAPIAEAPVDCDVPRSAPIAESPADGASLQPRGVASSRSCTPAQPPPAPLAARPAQARPPISGPLGRADQARGPTSPVPRASVTVRLAKARPPIPGPLGLADQARSPTSPVPRAPAAAASAGASRAAPGVGEGLRTSVHEGAMGGLSEEQQSVVVAPAYEAIFVVAAPGSGKTRVLARRVAHLVASGVPPSAILAITFSRRAAKELRERVLSLGAAGIDVLTFHALCVRLVRAHAPLLRLRADFGLVSGSQQLQLLQLAAQRASALLEAAAEGGGADGGAAEPLAAVIEEAGSQPRAARRLLRALTDGKTAAALRAARAAGSGGAPAAPTAVPECLRLLTREYDAVLSEQNVLDFCDAQSLALDLLTRPQPPTGSAPPALPALSPMHSHACAFRHILLDEFQDTSGLQFGLLSALLARAHAAFAPGDRAAAAGRPPAGACGLTVAGDPQQSIFGFRGAAPAVFEHALRCLPGGAPTVRTLATNYRSSANIVLVSICLLEPEAAADGPAALAERRGRAGALGGAALSMRTDNAPGAPVEVAEARVAETEADFIASRLHALRAGGAGARPCGWAEMAVLHRTNKEGAELCALLRARGVPAVQRGYSAFAGAAAGALLAALRCAASDADDGEFGVLAEAMGVPSAAMHALRTRANGSRLLAAARVAYVATSADAALIAASARGPPSAEAAAEEPRLGEAAREALGRLLRAVDAIRAEARTGDLAALPDVAARAGVLEGCLRAPPGGRRGAGGAEARAPGGAPAGGGGPAGPPQRKQASAETRQRRAAEAVAALSAEADAFLAAEAAEDEAELGASAARVAAEGGDEPAARPRARRGGVQALRRFLAHTALCEDERSAIEGSSEGLPVLTIHAAKGLEFEHVCLARLNEDCLPLASSRAQGADGDVPGGQLEEERRLAYVAATRARSSLALSYLAQLDGGPARRSRFLDGVLRLPRTAVRRSEWYEPRAADSWPRIARPPPNAASRQAERRR